MLRRLSTAALMSALALSLAVSPSRAQEKEKAQQEKPKQEQAKQERPAAPPAATFPPKLPDGKTVVTDKSEEFLKPGDNLKPGVVIAKTPPTVDFMYYPGQNYEGKPWSNWGDSVAANGKYYSAIGDHLAIGRGEHANGTGTGFVFEYDPATKTLRELVNTTKVLNLPEGHYTPGKIHSRIDVGSDGCLYFATHRGSTNVTVDKNHYKGDWIFRCDPKTGKTEVVVQGPVAKHCIPNSVLDPDRLIFYGGTAPGNKDVEDKGVQFFAYDIKNKKLLYSGPDGPSRYMMFAKSTGKLYYVPGNSVGTLMRFDPKEGGTPVEVPGSKIGIRAATQETPQGFIYTVSSGQGRGETNIWSFNTKTEEIKNLGPAPAASQAYIASIDADPTGRYLYYNAGAHGGSDRDGTPIVQFDVQTGQRKVIAFLTPFYRDKYGLAMVGTYGTALDPAGDKLYCTFNVNRSGKNWDVCGLAVVHIPESERTP